MGFALVFVLLLLSLPFAVHWMTCCPPEFPLHDPPCILYPVALTHPRPLAMVRSSLHIVSPFADSQLITLPCEMNVRLSLRLQPVCLDLFFLFFPPISSYY